MIRATIIGATGYTGHELVRILTRHPEVRINIVTSRQFAGHPLSEVFPSLPSSPRLICREPRVDEIAAETDVAFMAVPHGTAMQMVPALLSEGVKVVDLSADFRLKDRKIFERWYCPHTAPHLLSEAEYGLPELHRGRIKSARLVANPGCYPTAVVLGAVPLVRKGLVDGESIIADAKSGVSGAGRSASLSLSFCEVDEALRAYNVASHRHVPEMEQELSDVAGRKISVTFVPHLVPINRGILATIYMDLREKISPEELMNLYEKDYAREPFVRVLEGNALPNVSAVRGTNFCHIAPRVDENTGRAIILVAIDNLVKGASGQAVQNMNLMFGLPEETALKEVALFP